ncbi:MAG: isoprenylcysteine carboxylmethyltransferase family protein [Desulfobacterales bacterium]|jgi:protein-S-isoprenylcysteine O-methyltransferase Ste14
MDAQILSYSLLALMWSAYCAVHSLTISPPFLRWVKRRFPNGHRYHRLAFNLFSVLTLIPVAVYTLSLNTAPLFEWHGHLRWLQAAFIVTGITLIIAGASNYDFKEFSGLSQISNADACRSIGKDCELNTAGILGLVRHPWYTAVVCLLWARSLDTAAIIVNTVLTVYVVIGTHLEERKLIAAFGQTYRDYQKEVSMFLPIKWLISKIETR